MKKLTLAILVLFVLSTGTVVAGGFGGSCGFGGHSEKEMTSVQPSRTIILLELDDMRVELTDFSAKDKRYNVTDMSGEILASNLTEEDLSNQFPELFDALQG